MLIALAINLIIFSSTYVFSESSIVIVNSTVHSDPIIYKQLENESQVEVIIELKDNSNLTILPGMTKQEVNEIGDKQTAYFFQTEDAFLSTLNESEFNATYKFATSNSVSGYITQAGLEKVKNNPMVLNIIGQHEEAAAQIGLNVSTAVINATTVWGLGYGGQGQTICVIDSGINWSHPMMGGCMGPGCKVLAGYNYFDSNNNSMDYASHGTYVASIVAGIDVVNSSLLYRGVAPNASLISMKVCDANATKIE